MTMPLEGIRVVDWTQWQTGPVAAMMLADLGADVIKIEERTMGDPARGVERLTGLITFKTGRNAYYEMNNRNKRGITVDLRKEEGKEIIYKLVGESDVFLHNFLDSVVQRQKMDYDTLVKYNPKLIYVIASGYGPQGPDAHNRSFDYTGQARSGIMSMCGEPDMPPQRIEGGIADQMGAIMVAYVTVVALLARERLGVGQKVNASMLGALMWLQGLNIGVKLIGGEVFKRQSRKSPQNPLWNHYQCRDAKWIVLAHLQADWFWPNMCRAMGMEHLRDDSRFKDTEARRKNAPELITIMDEIFKAKTRDEWRDIFEKSDVIYSVLNDFDDLVNDPQVLANDYITDYDHPVWGRIRIPGIPIHLEKTPGQIRLPAPEWGQHTEEVLTDILGYTWEQITGLRDREVI